MNKARLRTARAAVLFMAATALVCAQDWKTATTLNGVDFAGLTDAQKALALKVLRENGCTCGCAMKMAQCRVEDPSCSYSNGLAKVVVASIKQGKSGVEALAAAKASKFGSSPQNQPVLESPVAIPTTGSPVTGPANAPVTIVEFSDFQCPYCAMAVPQIDALLKQYPTQIKLIFKQFPLSDIHPQSAMAAAASIAAHKQGKFWPMHNALYANYNRLSRETVIACAREAGLDMVQFEADLNSTEVKETVIRDVQDGDGLQVQGTPTLFINGQHYNGPVQLQALKPLLEAELKHPAAVVKASLSSK